MANTPKWNVRMRHEWLQTPLKKKRLKRCQMVRIGQTDGIARKVAKAARKAKNAENAANAKE